MKKTVLFLFAAISTLSALKAQPVLTSGSYNPIAGDVYYGHVLDTAGISIGASGPSATWNFSTVTEIDHDTTTYSSCTSTPYCDSFSTSNLASFDGTDYTYYNANSSALTLVGAFVSGTGTGTGILHFIDNKDLMRYPLTYNSRYTDTGSLSSGGLLITISDSNFADAYGTLILPTGTYTNVLRVHSVTLTTVSFGAIPVSSDRAESYTWYRPGYHNTLMVVDFDTTGSGILHKSGAEYYKGPFYSTGIDNVNIDYATMQVYPNPATDAINVKFDLQDIDGSSVTVSDITGRVIATIDRDRMSKGLNDISLSTSKLSAGIYMVQLHTLNGTTTQKVVVSK